MTGLLQGCDEDGVVKRLSMKKRYFLAVVVAFVMALSLAACSENAGADMSNDADETQAENQVNIQESAQENTQGNIQGENISVSQQNSEPTSDDNYLENDEEKEWQIEMKMNVQVGDYIFTATLENNEAVEELLDMMKEGPVTIEMDDYSGFEKVGSLGRSLTTSNSQTTTTAGDIVLYNGNNIVMFYGSNSWSYTKIGKIDDLSDWEKALGSGSITAVFTVGK